MHIDIAAGPAAAICAETLRQEGFQGQIIVATKEPHLPYDRPKLSKVTIANLYTLHVAYFKA